MNTVRRLYFYSLAYISAEVVIWGTISLLRTIFSHGLVGGSSWLAGGLSLVFVGIPIFWLHWRTVQRDARRDVEERASRVRAVFFYGALLTALVPFISSILAIISRGLVLLLGQPMPASWFGGNQNFVDNAIAILAQAVAFGYFWNLLRADWLSGAADQVLNQALADVRRLYRYVVMVSGLTMVVTGVYNLLRYLLYTPGQNVAQTVPMLAGALALLVVGLPLWAYSWRLIQNALVEVEERRSLLRLVVLYLISLAGVVGVLATAGRVSNNLIRWILGESYNVITFLQGNSAELGGLVPLAVMWWYYGDILNAEVSALPDQPRREALRRLYHYILALLGLSVSLAGLASLIDFIVVLLFQKSAFVGSFRGTLSGALSALLVGLPLWLRAWRVMRAEANRADDSGDHARRSVLRKAYLYLVLFMLVLGAMFFIGMLLFLLLDALLSGAGQDVGENALRMLLSFAVDVALLAYHWQALRADGQRAQETLGNLHAAFPTLILVEEDPGSQADGPKQEMAFANALLAELHRNTPRLPVAVHSLQRGAPDETMLGAEAIFLPLRLALNPSESLRLWLAEYQGRRLLIPLASAGWLLPASVEKSPQELAKEAAATLRQMAEGEDIRQGLPNSPWQIAGYVLGGLFGILLLIGLFALLVTSLFR